MTINIDTAAIVESGDEGAFLDKTDWLGAGRVLLRPPIAGSLTVGAPSTTSSTFYLGLDVAINHATAPWQYTWSLPIGIGRRQIREIDETYRRGLGVRFDAMYGESDRGAGGRDLRHRPLDEMRLTNGTRLQLLGEARYELIGCFAPFLHVMSGPRVGAARAEGTDLIDDSDQWEWSIPARVMAGAHADINGERMMLWAGYEVLIHRPEDNFTSDHRILLGVEWLPVDGGITRFGLDSELVFGANFGAYLTARMSLSWAQGGSP